MSEKVYFNSMRPIFLFILLFVLFFSVKSELIWAQDNKTYTIGGIAAIVNDEPISIYDLHQKTLLIMHSAKVEPTQENIQIAQIQAMRALINEKLQLQEARKFNIEISKEQVDSALARLAAQNNITADEIKSQLQSANIDIESFRNKIKAEIAWQTIVSGRYQDRMKLTDQEIKQTYQRIQSGLSKPQYNLSEIFLEAPLESDKPQIKEQTYEIIKLLQNGAPFPLIAQQYSVSASAVKGGEIGWISYGELQAELQAALDHMDVGQVSAPIEVSDGYYLIALKNKKDPSQSVNTIVRLKQILVSDIPENEKPSYLAKLSDFKSSYQDCNSLSSSFTQDQNISINDLGEIDLNALSLPIKEVITALKIGEISDPVSTDFGIQMIAVCDRKQIDKGMPSKEQIESRLIDQKLNMISRRYLRDLRHSASIESKL